MESVLRILGCARARDVEDVRARSVAAECRDRARNRFEKIADARVEAVEALALERERSGPAPSSEAIRCVARARRLVAMTARRIDHERLALEVVVLLPLRRR